MCFHIGPEFVEALTSRAADRSAVDTSPVVSDGTHPHPRSGSDQQVASLPIVGVFVKNEQHVTAIPKTDTPPQDHNMCWPDPPFRARQLSWCAALPDGRHDCARSICVISIGNKVSVPVSFHQTPWKTSLIRSQVLKQKKLRTRIPQTVMSTHSELS
jgi:hypothetical protein